MGIKLLSSLFKRQKQELPVPDFSERCQLLPISARNNNLRIDSVGSWASYDLKTSSPECRDFHNVATYLPHILVTSDLGVWDHTSRLRFSHFLPEDPSIAVFSESQDAAVPNAWRHNQSWSPWRLNIRYRWQKGGLQVRRSCTVRVIVGTRWQYKISMKAIRHWSAPAGMLLVDWNALYQDYFAQDGGKKNSKRAYKIKIFRKLEERTVMTETGARWPSCDDWDIHQPTISDAAFACRYEER
jgi:hypothetical protein